MSTHRQAHPDPTGLERELEHVRAALDRFTQIINDLNNLLTVMRGHAQLASEDPSEKNVQELIRAVLASTSRAQRQIREVFGRADVTRSPAETPHPPRTARILVVDDEQLVRDLMRQILTKSGHEVVAVASPDSALQACQKQSYDAIFMDIRLGKGEDGIAAFRRIRQLQPDSHVVFLSGDPNIEALWQQVRAEGADGFIKKPFDISEIDGVVFRLLTFPTAGGRG